MHFAGLRSSVVNFWRCIPVMGVHPRVASVRSPLLPTRDLYPAEKRSGSPRSVDGRRLASWSARNAIDVV
eukprot:7111535-Alexandrium_andersonii.AAC.1